MRFLAWGIAAVAVLMCSTACYLSLNDRDALAAIIIPPFDYNNDGIEDCEDYGDSFVDFAAAAEPYWNDTTKTYNLPVPFRPSPGYPILDWNGDGTCDWTDQNYLRSMVNRGFGACYIGVADANKDGIVDGTEHLKFQESLQGVIDNGWGIRPLPPSYIQGWQFNDMDSNGKITIADIMAQNDEACNSEDYKIYTLPSNEVQDSLDFARKEPVPVPGFDPLLPSSFAPDKTNTIFEQTDFLNSNKWDSSDMGGDVFSDPFGLKGDLIKRRVMQIQIDQLGVPGARIALQGHPWFPYTQSNNLWYDTTEDVNFADLSGDGKVSYFEVLYISSLSSLGPGDANGDGRYTSSDLVTVMLAGQYEDTVWLNSTWETGDWNFDGEFTSADLIEANLRPPYYEN